MQIKLFDQTGGQVAYDLYVQRWEVLLHRAGQMIGGQLLNIGTVEVVLILDSEMSSLNQDYRGVAATTDVLSFSFITDHDEDFFVVAGEDRILGQIFISIEQITRQAEDFKVSVFSELNKMFVHGLLHICGFDHQKECDFLVMHDWEEKLLKE